MKWELDNPGRRKPIAVYPHVRGNVAIATFSDNLAQVNKAYSP